MVLGHYFTYFGGPGRLGIWDHDIAKVEGPTGSDQGALLSALMLATAPQVPCYRGAAQESSTSVLLAILGSRIIIGCYYRGALKKMHPKAFQGIEDGKS